MRSWHLALLGAALATPAAAQTVQLSAVLEGDLGYATNPFVASDVTAGSFFSSVSIAPRFFYQTARSTTALDGKYTRENYVNNFGYTDAGTVGLTRTDQWSEHLASTLSATYVNTNRATIADPDMIIDDPLNIGRRTKSFLGSYELQWQASAHDQLSYGASVSHLSYGNPQGQAQVLGISSSYTQYAINSGYNHIIDARTTVGAQVSLSSVQSQLYPDSRSVQVGLTGRRQLSTVWVVDGNVGIAFSRVDDPLVGDSRSLSLGFNICGVYPHSRMCLKYSRSTSPSGNGPLRRLSGVDATFSHDLDEHSRVTANASYRLNSSGAFTATGTPVLTDGKTILASSEYDRDLTARVSAGFGGQYEWRKLSRSAAGQSYSATVHVRAKLGRM